MTQAFAPQKVLFVGTRPLATRCLQYLLSRLPRDRFAGILGLQPGEYGWWSGHGVPELWELARDHEIPLVQERDLPDLDFDLLLCCFWATIFKEDVLAKPRYGCINLHTAPLPDYRGCHAYNHAILNRADRFGTTMHYMTRGIDRGDILRMIEFPVLNGETAYDLYLRTVEYSYAMFVEVWQRLNDGSADRVPQDVFGERTGRQPRYYEERSLDPYLVEPDVPLDLPSAMRLYNGLFNPPKSEPPKWLQRRLAGIRTSEEP